MFVEGFVDKKHVAKEKLKAKELRQSSWWKQKVALGECHYCKQKFAPATLTMDHVVPISRGGRSTKGNTVPACKECNNKKKYYTPADLIFMDLDAK